jgi:hypothetical protein
LRAFSNNLGIAFPCTSCHVQANKGLRVQGPSMAYALLCHRVNVCMHVYAAEPLVRVPPHDRQCWCRCCAAVSATHSPWGSWMVPVFKSCAATAVCCVAASPQRTQTSSLPRCHVTGYILSCCGLVTLLYVVLAALYAACCFPSNPRTALGGVLVSSLLVWSHRPLPPRAAGQVQGRTQAQL